MIPTNEELHKKVVGDIGLQCLQNRLLPLSEISNEQRKKDAFSDYSSQGFLEPGESLVRHYNLMTYLY